MKLYELVLILLNELGEKEVEENMLYKLIYLLCVTHQRQYELCCDSFEFSDVKEVVSIMTKLKLVDEKEELVADLDKGVESVKRTYELTKVALGCLEKVYQDRKNEISKIKNFLEMLRGTGGQELCYFYN